jgi:hypothetical protein
MKARTLIELPDMGPVLPKCIMAQFRASRFGTALYRHGIHFLRNLRLLRFQFSYKFNGLPFRLVLD